jgi:predicted Zn-dependent protease
MVFGDDPRQGYVEKNVFYHPLLRFSFSFPEEWTLQNTPAQIVLSSKDGNAVLVLQAEKSSEELSAFAQKKMANIEGKQYLSDQHLTINNLSAYQQLYDIDQEEKEDLRLRLTCIKKEEHIYSWSSLSTTSDFSEYDSQFRPTVHSFKKLTNRTYINRKPKRIRLIRANGRDSLGQIFKKAGMPEEQWPKFAIMNTLELDEKPVAEKQIKIVR